MNKWIVVILFSLELMACSASDDTLTHYLNTIKNQLMHPADPVPQLKSLPKFFYPKRNTHADPFLAKSIHSQTHIHFPKEKQLSKSFAIDSIRYCGMLKQDSFLWAIISWPNGKLSSVRPGDYLEKNSWKVIKIKDDSLLIERQFFVAGQWIKKVKALHFG